MENKTEKKPFENFKKTIWYDILSIMFYIYIFGLILFLLFYTIPFLLKFFFVLLIMLFSFIIQHWKILLTIYIVLIILNLFT